MQIFSKKKEHHEDKLIIIPSDRLYPSPRSPIDMFREEIEKEIKNSKQ